MLLLKFAADVYHERSYGNMQLLSTAMQDMAQVAPPEAPAPQMRKAREPHAGAMAGDTPQVRQRARNDF